MQFEQRFNQLTEKAVLPPARHLWLRSLFFSLLISVLIVVYLSVTRSQFDVYIINKALGDISVVLIGLSLALSGLCYFWDFVDTKIVYRKHLGIWGFVAGAAHVILTLFVLPRYSWERLFGANVVSSVLGLVAIGLFVILALISNQYGIKELGGKRWRQILRYGGYLGFLAVGIHFILIKYSGWIDWLNQPTTWPPMSLISAAVVIAVIILRVILWASQMSHKRHIAEEKGNVPKSPML